MRPGGLLGGRYEVGPLLGLGGTAQVHRAWDHRRGHAVAVKIFRPGAAPAPGQGSARELRVLAGVSHPGLVAMHDSGVDADGSPFIVMDLVDGVSLATRLYDGPLPTAAVARLGVVLAEALAVVHARGVVHRDVKPANVLLDADDRPWLTDFGIARIVDATRVTATGLVVGTAAYMAPEQVRGEVVGPAADVYALGLVLLEAVTGHREYEGGALESALARLHRAPLVPDAVPDPLAATLHRMTALHPSDRPTAADVAAALRDPGFAVDPVRRTGRPAAPAVALACLLAAALGGAFALADPKPAPAGVVAAAAPPAVVAAPAVQPVFPEAAEQPVATVGKAPPRPVPVALKRDHPLPGTVATADPVSVARSGPPQAEDITEADDRPGDDRNRGDDGDGAATDEAATDEADTPKDDGDAGEKRGGEDRTADGDGSRSDGSQSNGRKSDSPKSDSPKSDAPWSDGSKSDAPKSNDRSARSDRSSSGSDHGDHGSGDGGRHGGSERSGSGSGSRSGKG